MRNVKKLYTSGNLVRITGKETDISFSTEGRRYLLGDGSANMPDGEIYTSPVEDSVNGHIFFEFPGVYAGKIIHGIRLNFKNGKLISAKSTNEQELLDDILNMDEGASVIGEFGVGLNYNITKFCYDILFDEKIGGTIHLAVGRGYTECGGKNYSALHWDIIKDLREEGAIYINGEKIMENGKYQL